MTLYRRLGLTVFLLLCSLQSSAQDASIRSDGALLPRESKEAGVFRGGVVFTSYCATCHGINATGNGRAARLYTPRPANLRTSDKNDAYMMMIIRMGGEALGRSKFMPPWGGELTEEQMRDVTTYLRSINEAGGRDVAVPR